MLYIASAFIARQSACTDIIPLENSNGICCTSLLSCQLCRRLQPRFASGKKALLSRLMQKLLQKIFLPAFLKQSVKHLFICACPNRHKHSGFLFINFGCKYSDINSVEPAHHFFIKNLCRGPRRHKLTLLNYK